MPKSWFRQLRSGSVLVLLCAIASPLTLADESAKPGSGKSKLQGRAFVDRNQRVMGCSIQVRADNDPSRLFLTSADKAGTFSVAMLPDGDYSFVVRRDGFEPVVKERVSLRFPFRAVVDVKMQPGQDTPRPFAVGEPSGETAHITGRVLGLDNQPLRDIRVRFVHPEGAHDPIQFQTGGKGTFAIDALPVGAWRIDTQGVGYIALRDELRIDGDLELALVLVPQPADYEMSPLELAPSETIAMPASLQLDLPESPSVDAPDEADVGNEAAAESTGADQASSPE